MTGETRRQHFLPRFLLKGFASRNRRDRSYAYCFRLGHEPYETNIINLGVGMDFYGRGPQHNVEAGLSVVENEHAEIVERIRRDGIVGDARGVGEVVRYLLVRTKHTRDGFTEAAHEVISSLDAVLGTTEGQGKIAQLVRKKAQEDARIQAVYALAQKVGMSPAAIDQLFDLYFRHVDLPAQARQFMGVLATPELDAAIATGHIGSLDRATRERPVAENDADWSLLRTAPRTLVLGDVAVVARYEDGYGHLLRGQKSLQALLIPLSHQDLLVGRMSGANPVIEPDAINLASAELSREFFISCQCTHRERSYQGRIGTGARLLAPGQAARLATEVLDGH